MPSEFSNRTGSACGIRPADGSGAAGVAGRRFRGDALRAAWGVVVTANLLDVWWPYAPLVG
uniref:Uncharacterized protein n=1 Tax=Verrucosispora sp. MS100047 TaxID=1410949 RepID=A0A097CRX4_9ACTN|nr:hypothetical protein VASRM7_173 [Verrucosispora sp. MS100047]